MRIKLRNLNRIAKEIIKIKNVQAIYLFGSQAIKKNHVLSDIDICIFGKLNNSEKNKIAGYGSENLDISFFDELPIWIKMRVFKGKEIAVKNKEFVKEEMIRTMREYLDFKYILNKYSYEVLKCTI
jgi:predicted nucleotidyltransferase